MKSGHNKYITEPDQLWVPLCSLAFIHPYYQVYPLQISTTCGNKKWETASKKGRAAKHQNISIAAAP